MVPKHCGATLISLLLFLFIHPSHCFTNRISKIASFPTSPLFLSSQSSDEKKKSKKPYISPPKSPIIDHIGRTWHSNKDLTQYYSLQRDQIPYISTSTPWVAHLGVGQSMLRRKSSPNQKPHFEEDDERWMHHYEKLVAFKSEFGHTDVPLKWEEDESLGRWCVKQRYQYGAWLRNGGDGFNEGGKRVAFISRWRIRKLEELGFDWWGAYWKWEERLDELREFKEKNGHLMISKEDDDDLGLYYWMLTQRRDYNAMLRGEKSQMTIERKKQLDELGFDWDPRQTVWDNRLQQLIGFKKKYGHYNVVAINNKNSTKSLSSLERWVSRQREEYRNLKSKSKKSYLTSKRIIKLQEIGFEFEPVEANWNSRYRDLETFKAKHGHCDVPVDYENNTALGKWVAQQRYQLKDANKAIENQSNNSLPALTESRIASLNKIDFIWDVKTASWDHNLLKLKQFKEKHGHVDVPHSFPEDPSLWHWVNSQRTSYRAYRQNEQSGMTSQRIEILSSLGFRWNVFHDSWNERFQQLIAFRDIHMHCNVPKDYEEDPSFYLWVQTQRRQYKLLEDGQPSSMTETRIQMLESIGFCWNTNQAVWNERYEELRSYRDMNGHCRVPVSFEENPKLGRWVSVQRVQYRKMTQGDKSSMTSDRVKLLNELGFKWSLR